MKYEWDRAKAASNVTKHGVRFADAVSALEDDCGLTMRDPFAEEEERWITVGMNAEIELLVVIFTWRGESIRIIQRDQRAHAKDNNTRRDHEARIRFQ